MLKDVLYAMSASGVRSHADLAERLGVSEGLLSQMMEDLARKGYVASTSLTICGCRHCLSGVCGTGGSTPGQAWVLTAKGEAAVER